MKFRWLLIPRKVLKKLYEDFSALWDGIPYIDEDEQSIVALGKKFEELLNN